MENIKEDWQLKNKFVEETGEHYPSDENYKYTEWLTKLILSSVVSSCVDKDTLIEDLNDKRIIGKTIDENMWHYCRKETAEHLLDKYEIRPKQQLLTT